MTVIPTDPFATLLFILATIAPLVVCVRVVGQRGRAAVRIADTLSPRGRSL